jgi:hypothetical protein
VGKKPAPTRTKPPGRANDAADGGLPTQLYAKMKISRERNQRTVAKVNREIFRERWGKVA